MKIKVRNTKTNKQYVFSSFSDVIRTFMNKKFSEDHTLRSEYEACVEACDTPAEKRDIITYWKSKFRKIHETEEELALNLITYERWSSPLGLVSKYEIESIER